MDILICVIVTLLNHNWRFFNKWVLSVFVLGGEFILLLFIGVMAAGCWSGGCFWEVYNILILC